MKKDGTTNDKPKDNKKQLSTGAIVGIVVGCVVFVALVIVVIVVVVHKRSSNGRMFESYIKSNEALKFSIVSKLSDQEIGMRKKIPTWKFQVFFISHVKKTWNFQVFFFRVFFMQ